MTSGFDSTEMHGRVTAVRASFDDWNIDGLLIESAANRRWLSGFTGSSGILLVTREQAWLATDFRYWEQAHIEAAGFTLFREIRSENGLTTLIRESGVSRVGIESSFISLKRFRDLEAVPDVSWVALDQSCEPVRRLKSEAELSAIRKAAAITDLAMGQVNAIARVGMSERDLAWELEKVMREAGADELAFPIIVAAGPNSALPHHHPTDRRLAAGDALIVDMGAAYGGYRADLTRTFFLGRAPTAQFDEIYQLVLQANQATIDQGQAEMTAAEIDSLARDLITSAGYGDQFGHGLGHAVGLEIHEQPIMSQSAAATADVVRAGTVLTVEPGIYLPGWGGVRIEDLVLVTNQGLELVSQCAKEPIIAVA